LVSPAASGFDEIDGVTQGIPVPAPIPVVLVPHDPRWAEAAQREGERFAGALPIGSLDTLHHIGSTAIPGIHAKPILDLLPVVTSHAAIDAATDRLAALGYEAWGEYGLPGRRFFTRESPTGRVANVHVYERGAPAIARHLAFRDYVRAHRDVARAYETEKLRARALHPGDSYAYTDEKSAFIRRIEADAIAWSRSDD
jgi:GrpB-like predicted nucleotidyltransferase (UPF0157 family)